MDKLENGILKTDALAGRAGASILKNAGKAIAVITIALAILLTFTEIHFSEFGTQSFTSNLIMMLIASYLMYFSLEDAGERLGEESEEYREALTEYSAARSKIGCEDVEELRDFCIEYSRSELEYRRRATLVSEGLSLDEYERWRAGERFARKSRRIFRRIRRMRAARLTPAVLLTQSEGGGACEISNPTRRKIPRMIVRMIPTTIGMTVTVSVMLTMKDGMSAVGIIESVLKLSTLPIIGFRGYAAGYSHVLNAVTPWLKTRCMLISAFTKRSEGS